MYNIIIADSSEMFSNELAFRLPKNISAKICSNFDDVLESLENGNYKLVVLDLSISGCDGFEMVYELADLPEPPAVLASTPYISEFVRSSMAGIGIGYLFNKPCKLDSVVARIQEMLAYYSNNSTVEDPLVKLRVPTRLSGSNYIRCALPMLMQQPNIQLTKELYPRIAAIYKQTGQSVERSIRSVIHNTWKVHDGYIWQEYLPTDETGRTYRPSNGDFFEMLLHVVSKTG